jgi:ABC-type multidrug transport system ATPase subunit
MAEICDHVVVMQAGRIIDQGSPAELVKTCPWFADFAAASYAEPSPEGADEGAEEEEDGADEEVEAEDDAAEDEDASHR